MNGVIDGEATAKQPDARLWDRTDAVTHIGTSAPLPFRNWFDQYFDGLIDEVAIWRRALSPDEVRELYQTTARKVQQAQDIETNVRPSPVEPLTRSPGPR